jgi:Immunoglobulin V-set domain
VTVSEAETVHLSCPMVNMTAVFWRVRTLVDGAYHKSIVRQNETGSDFKKTGRYYATYNKGHHILTIEKVNVTEAGEYQCSEDGYFGQTSKPVGKIVLKVYGRWIGSFQKTLFSFNCYLMILQSVVHTFIIQHKSTCNFSKFGSLTFELVQCECIYFALLVISCILHKHFFEPFSRLYI